MLEIEEGILLLGIILALGFGLGKISHKLRLTSIVGYLLAGVLLGTFGVELPKKAVEFVIGFTLSLVAFTIGCVFTRSMFKKIGKTVFIAMFSESFFAFSFVLAAIFLYTGDLPKAILFGSLAPASAPAGTIAAIRECRAKGRLTNIATAIVGLDDSLSIFIYVFSLAFVKTILGGIGSLNLLLKPFIEIGGAILIGILFGISFAFILTKMKRREKEESIFIISMFSVFLCWGIAEALEFSPILASMIFGCVVVNITPRLLRSIYIRMDRILETIFIIFFVVAGLELEPRLLLPAGFLALVYILSRSGGLIFGGWVGAVIAREKEKVKKYLGSMLLSQAGVAIGLAAMASTELSSLGEAGTKLGALAITIIAATTIFFEFVGPMCVKYSLKKAGEARSE